MNLYKISPNKIMSLQNNVPKTFSTIIKRCYRNKAQAERSPVKPKMPVAISGFLNINCYCKIIIVFFLMIFLHTGIFN